MSPDTIGLPDTRPPTAARSSNLSQQGSSIANQWTLAQDCSGHGAPDLAALSTTHGSRLHRVDFPTPEDLPPSPLLYGLTPQDLVRTIERPSSTEQTSGCFRSPTRPQELDHSIGSRSLLDVPL